MRLRFRFLSGIPGPGGGSPRAGAGVSVAGGLACEALVSGRYFPEFQSTRPLDNMHNAMVPIFKLAVKANVAIYTIDSRGLYASPGDDVSRNVVASVANHERGLYTSPGADASRNVVASGANQVNREWNDVATDEGMTLSEIAEATGGTAFKNSNDLLAGLQRAFADGREYYTLAYVSTNQVQDGKFRKIEVMVRDSKAVVNAKRGYWATSQ